MARAVPAILCCDCVSWRLDLFEEALERIGEAARRWDTLAEIRLGYRLKDDVAFLVIEPGLLAESRIGVLAASDAGLPGLRALDLPPDGPSPEQVRERLLGSCDVVGSALAVNDAVARLRSVLGMGDDRRTTVRLSVALPLRFSTPGGWIDASALDLSSSGVFVETLPGATASELLHRIRHLGGEVDLPVAVLMSSPASEGLLSAGATALLPSATPSDVAHECMKLVAERRATATK